MKTAAVVILMTCLAILLPAKTSRNPEQCTSAILLPHQSSSASAVLWKNRDTGVLSNRVVYVKEQPFSYLGLCDRQNRSGRAVFAGLNSEGFGIINTVAYNLPLPEGEQMDMEGIIMADALRTCRTTDDFEAYLKAHQGPDLGSQANFAVLDSRGKSLLFEVHNHGYSIVDPKEFGPHGLINTNFSRSGTSGQGAGYLRFERATWLFDQLPSGPVGVFHLLTRFTRDTGNALVRQPTPFDPLPNDHEDVWISTKDSINKYDTSAAIVIVGRNPLERDSVATLWIIPGEPICAPALPLWVEAGSSPDEFCAGDEAPLWQASLAIKKTIRPHREGNRAHYLNLSRLVDPAKGGYLPQLMAFEARVIQETQVFLAQKPARRDHKTFQEKQARSALALMMGIFEKNVNRK